MAVSSLAKIGVAFEGSWGAGGSPAVVMPVDDWSLTGPYDQVLDNARRGVLAKDFAAYQGIGHSEASFSGPLFPDLIGYPLKAIFGALATTGTTEPYTHTFTFAGTPPSIALTEYNVVRQHQGFGLLCSEFSISFNPTEGILSYSTSWTGQKLGTVSYTFPSELYVGTPFILGWQGSVALDGTYFPIIEGEMTISREVALHYNLRQTQYAGTAYVDAPELTGSFTIDYTSGTDYDRYMNHTQGSVDLLFQIDANRSLQVQLGSVDFGEGAVELDHSGPAITLGYSWRALYVSALGGPAKAILTCNTPTF